MAEMTQLSTKRRTIREQVSRYPMAAYIALAYAISWIAWLLSFRIQTGVVNGFEFIASAGPALAAMIVSSILRPEPSGIQPGKRWRLFAIVCLLALALMTSLRLWLATGLITVANRGATAVAYPAATAFPLDVVAAAVVGYVFSGVLSRRQGVRDLLQSLDPRRLPVRWYWWIVAIAFYPVFYALGSIISTAIGLPVSAPQATGLWYWLVLDAAVMSLYGLVGGGGLEEPGWRGFALPWLQKRYSPLGSSLILAVVWGLWHWPMFWLGLYGGGPLGVFGMMLIGAPPIAVLFTAVFNRSGGSLLVAILLHASINTAPVYVPASAFGPGLWMLLMLGLALWMWRSPQMFAPRRAEHETI